MGRVEPGYDRQILEYRIEPVDQLIELISGDSYIQTFREDADPPRGRPSNVYELIQTWNASPILVRLPKLDTTGYTTCRGMEHLAGLRDGPHPFTLVGDSNKATERRSWSVRVDLAERMYRIRPVDVVSDEEGRGGCSLRGFGDADVLADLRSEYIDTAGKENKWRNVPFAEAFPELNSRIALLADLSVSQADRYLKDLRRQTPQPVELFGARMPSGAIASIGAILLVLSQLYFRAHLEQLIPGLKAPRGSPKTGHRGSLQNRPTINR